MRTLPDDAQSLSGLPFINSRLERIDLSKGRVFQAVLATLLTVATLACGSASSNSTPPPPAAPTISSFTPASGVTGTVVTITGTNFSGATALTFNSRPAANFSVDSATQITATVAAGTTTGRILVGTPNGTTASSTNFTILNAPTISSFSPSGGVAGNSVTITGTNFTGATVVRFNTTAAASFTVDSDTQITAVVANSTTAGKITVTTLNGTATSLTNFTITNSPTISSFNPSSGAPGTSVTITGTNFTGATSVKFNGMAAASYTVDSATQITAAVANGATTGSISVTTPNGTATSSTNFTVNASGPTISAFNPGSGPVNTAVIITGTNFTGATSVAFNGKAASGFTVNSATQITATVASGSTTGKITVTTSGGTATSATNFTVTNGTATLDLSIEGLYITQATQEYPNPSVPLVQNRSAWVRVFVKANQINTATPQVKVDFIKGTTTNSITINAGGTSVPLSIDPENAAASWNAAFSSAWIQTGTQVVATVDPTNAIQEADETNNTFTQNMDVRNLKPWKITLIPVHTTDGNQGNVLGPGRTANDWIDFAKRIHPVPDAIDVVVGNVMNSGVASLKSDNSDGSWNTVLTDVSAKHSADGATDRYYFGAVHTTYFSGVAGLGQIGAPNAIGWDVSGSFPSVLAHEVGHNFGDYHSPCGNPSGVDPNYPYPGAIIGVPGWDVFASSSNLKGSSAYVDIMSYCSPVWISDYTYLNELIFRQNSPLGIIVPGPDVVAPTGDGLLVWGRIVNGQVTLEPAFRIPANNSQATPGSYIWQARDKFGSVLASVSFSAAEVADLPDNRSVQIFSFVVPLQPEIFDAMQTMHVMTGKRELVHRTVSATPASDFQNAVRMQDLPNGRLQMVWDGDRYPVLMLRDAHTGEVRGLVRGGSAEIEAAPDEIVVHAPDGPRTEVVRHRRIPE